MKIQVQLGSTAYTYWIDGEVAVGDKVLIPGPYWAGRDALPQEVTVSAVGSDYDGPLSRAWTPKPG